jgi:hypothetical protein
MAVTVDARTQAAAGEGVTVGRRAHAVRHRHGKTASTERLETEVVEIAGFTTYDQYGTPECGGIGIIGQRVTRCSGPTPGGQALAAL